MTRGDRIAFGELILAVVLAGWLVRGGEVVIGVVLGALAALALVLMLIGGHE